MDIYILKRFNELVHNYHNHNFGEKEINSNNIILQSNTIKNGSSNKLAEDVIPKILEESQTQKLNIEVVAADYLLEHLKSLFILYEMGSSYCKEKMEAISLIKMFLSQNIICKKHLLSILFDSKLKLLPLDLLWYLSQMELISLEQILNKVINDQARKSQLVKDGLSLTLKRLQDDNAEVILIHFYKILLTLAYEINDDKYELIRNVSNKLLQEILNKFLEFILDVPGNSENKESQNRNSFINIYQLLNNENLNADILSKFITNQLITILTFKPDIPLNFVIKEQTIWRSTNSNRRLTTVLSSIIKILGYIKLFKILDEVVVNVELNWRNVLTLISLLSIHQESATELKDWIDSYLETGINEHKLEYLIVAFACARRASLEEKHLFPLYNHWFGSTFGLENSSLANNKKAFKFLFHFLTDLVPYETSFFLGAHIRQPIFVPKGCQHIFREYQQLARVRLKELEESMTPFGIEKAAASESLLERTKAENDVMSAISHFEKFGKVPSFILEASIFKRPYYFSYFLPSLLTPRSLPNPDVRMKLVNTLFSLGKIPEKAYASYIDESKLLSLQ